MYTCHLLSPASTPDALAHNEGVFALQVLGIEVTVPNLAARCSLGNVDSQHGEAGSEASSAIEVALTMPLPPAGTGLATIRPDSDSVGAMAVLTLRAAGKPVDESLCVAIGRLDALGPRAFDLAEVQRHHDAVRAATWQSLSATLDLGAKVDWMCRLLGGQVERAEVERLAGRANRELEEARRLLQVTRLPGGRVALVTGSSPRGLEVGYESGAGIVACWSEWYLRPGAAVHEPPVAKWTVARRTPDEPIDIAALRRKLNRLEVEHGGRGAWGGPANLVGSPQGESTFIPPERVLAMVLECVRA